MKVKPTLFEAARKMPSSVLVSPTVPQSNKPSVIRELAIDIAAIALLACLTAYGWREWW
jgi:hypothetical protein